MLIKRFKLRRRAGFTLVEVLISLIVAGAAVAQILGLSQSVQRMSVLNGQRLQANMVLMQQQARIQAYYDQVKEDVVNDDSTLPEEINDVTWTSFVGDFAEDVCIGTNEGSIEVRNPNNCLFPRDLTDYKVNINKEDVGSTDEAKFTIEVSWDNPTAADNLLKVNSKYFMSK